MILTILLVFILVILFVQLSKINKPITLILGLVIGFLMTIILARDRPIFLTYGVKSEDICTNGCSEPEPEPEPEHIYRRPAEAFPLDFGLGQKPKIDFNANCQNEVPDGWENIGAEMGEYSKVKTKYDIDNCIVNGNVVDPGRPFYNDDFYLEQQKRYGDDAYTAANLHFSRKPKEAFNYQSRWGINSLRPYLAAELDDHANRIWYEDNPDLDQFM